MGTFNISKTVAYNSHYLYWTVGFQNDSFIQATSCVMKFLSRPLHFAYISHLGDKGSLLFTTKCRNMKRITNTPQENVLRNTIICYTHQISFIIFPAASVY